MAEEKKDKGTIWQRLTKVINSDTYETSSVEPQNDQSVQTPQNNEKELLTATSVEELNTKKLEAQQNKYLKDQYQKVTNNLYQQSVFYETTRLGTYMDTEAMEFYPAIATALDIFAEEATVPGSDGNSLHITSDSPRVKKILQNLFYNTLDINTNLPAWTRNACKYGDNFLFLKTDKTKGVINCAQLPNIEITRKEGDMFGEDSDTKTALVRFLWQNRNIEFNSWQIAHFRMIGDDRRLPYGTSILEKARKVFKQLVLLEDAAAIYRISRAPERRVFKIDVGNIDDKDVDAYVQRIASKFKKTPQLNNSATGAVDLRYNSLPIWKETPIPLLDGRTLTIEQLAKEYDNGKTNWVYSIQDKTHQIVAGKVVWCGKNYTANTLIKVWLDDNTWIMTAPEHPFIMRDGTSKRADELSEGESLMPFYSDNHKIRIDSKSEYERVFNPYSSKYEFTHRLIGKEIKKENKEYNTIHHVNFQRLDNSPTNLLWVDFEEHKKMHSELNKKNWENGIYYRVHENFITYNKSDAKRERSRLLGIERQTHLQMSGYNSSDLHKEHNVIRREAQIKDWADPNKKIERSLGMRIKFDDFIWNEIRINILNGKINRRNELIDFINNELINYLISINKNDRLNNLKKISRTVLQERIIEKGFETISHFISENKKNHKVSKIEIINKTDDVYCMTVVGNNGEDDRHNFAVCSFNENGNYKRGGVFLKNSVDQDFFIPVRNGNSQTVIDTLNGASNLDQIKDMEYFQNNLLTALRVPKAFLGFAEAAGDGKNLAMQDVRFARTVNRVQQCMIQELNKIAIIHLFMLGLEDELNNFTLSLTNPSTQAETLKIEQLNAKLEAYSKAVTPVDGSFAPMSLTKAKKEILGMSDAEIVLDLQQQKLERSAAIEAQEENVAGKITTGIFKNLDARYSIGANPEEIKSPSENPTGDELGDFTPPEVGNIPTPEGGGENAPETAPEAPTVAENKYSIEDKGEIILSENVKKMLNGIDNLLKDDDKKPL